jgi:hypothetical protein
MTIFKELIVKRLFNAKAIPTTFKPNETSTSFTPHNEKSKKPPPISKERVRIFTFTGVEIRDEDELSMIENNSYLFVSLGKIPYPD